MPAILIPDEPNSKPAILVDVNGDDLSILIGPKAETLNALQYIAGLIVGKEVGHSIPLVVDVEGFPPAPRAAAPAACSRPHRLGDQDAALSRLKPGFESLWGHLAKLLSYFANKTGVFIQGPGCRSRSASTARIWPIGSG
jgi:hypothetical protein